MEALLAMSLISAGSNVVDNVVDACKTTATSISNAASTSFDKVLGSEIDKTRNPYATMSADELSTARTQLENKLESSSDIKNFVGNDKTFTIKAQGGNYIVRRADGTIWKIPPDSELAETARDYCKCRSAQATLDGNPKTGVLGWEVSVEEE